MTQDKFEQLMGTIRRLHEGPTGEHLTDEDFDAFVLEEMSPEQDARIEAHLASCPDCTLQLVVFFEGTHTVSQEEFAQRLRTRLEEEGLVPSEPRAPGFSVNDALERFRAFLAAVPEALSGARIELAFAPGFNTPEPWDHESEEGRFGMSVWEGDDREVTIYIDSQDMGLEGTLVRLQAGQWQRDVPLRKVADDLVGAKVVMSRAEREKLSRGTVLRATVVSGPPHTDQATS